MFHQTLHQAAPLYPSTRSWEVPRQHVTLEKIIGKGAFGQVAKGTPIDLRGRPGKTRVAIKRLRGVKCFKNIGKIVQFMLCYANRPFLAWSLGRL